MIDDRDLQLYRSDKFELDTGLSNTELVVAIGDVHGCARQLDRLLEACSLTASEHDQSTLVFLGDLIDRGPDPLDALDLAINAGARGFGRAVHLMGNHEQMLRLSIRGWFSQSMGMTPMELWMMNGANLPIDIPWLSTISPEEFGDRIGQMLGKSRMDLLQGLKSHHRHGNLLFVHAGVHPYRDIDAFLDLPWDSVTDSHWCWIREPFLNWPVTVPGLTVVHGHTPVRSCRMPEIRQHKYNEGKINLDSFSYFSGRVMAAEFTSDGYRLVCAYPIT